jgi:hypothetical protein
MFTRTPGYVYFLVDGSRVVYIGQTTNICHRLRQHKRDKMFTQVWVLEVDEDRLDEVEAHYIQKIRPWYNGGTALATVAARKKDLGSRSLCRARPEFLEVYVPPSARNQCYTITGGHTLRIDPYRGTPTKRASSRQS